MKKLIFLFIITSLTVNAQFKKLDKYLTSKSNYLISNQKKDSLIGIVDKILLSENKNITFISDNNSNQNITSQLIFQSLISKFDLDLNVYSYNINTIDVISKNMIDSLSCIGFKINKMSDKKSYLIKYDWSENEILIFPKLSNNFQNPTNYITINVDNNSISSISEDVYFIADRLSKMKYYKNLYTKN